MYYKKTKPTPDFEIVGLTEHQIFNSEFKGPVYPRK
jgi:hypothetical protein